MKIEYSYLDYKDFPRATAISQSRARNQMYFSMFAFIGFVLSLLMLCTCKTVSDWIEGILSVAICFGAMMYMKKVYPKNTKKKIEKAIEEGIAEKQRVAEMIASRPKGVSFIDYRDSKLIVVFKNGLEYRHSNVPIHIYEEFKKSPTAEDYYNSQIKNNYPLV